MVTLFLSTIISCSDAALLIQRVTKSLLLNDIQKREVIEAIKQTVPVCPSYELSKDLDR